MPAKHAEDHALVERLLAGDVGARETLARRHVIGVRRAVGFLAASRFPRTQPSDIDDAVQHVFLTVFANDARVLVSWHGNASLRTYLARIAERVASRHFTRTSKTQGRFRLALDAPISADDASAQIDRVPADAQRVDEQLSTAETRDRVRALILEQLTELGQMYYQALFIDDLSISEIAKREATNPNNVYQWKNRIMQVARDVLASEGYLK